MQIPLTPEQRIVLETRLADARLAYHTLMTGTQAKVIVDQNGEKVEFSSINRLGLYGYIQQLEAQLAVCPASLRAFAPAGFFF